MEKHGDITAETPSQCNINTKAISVEDRPATKKAADALEDGPTTRLADAADAECCPKSGGCK